MFHLDRATATLAHVNLRAEIHGEDKKPAADLKLTITGPNSLLDLFDEKLRGAIYTSPPARDAEELFETEPPLNVLRFPYLGTLRWDHAEVGRHPSCDWIVIPDVIDGDEAANDALLRACPLGAIGVPVYHLHESTARLERLVSEYPRVALGSSGAFSVVGNARWWNRMAEVMRVACDADGFPRCKLHGLRMLDPAVFSRLPLASADSTTIGRKLGIDNEWRTRHAPPTKEARAAVLRARIESFNAPARWAFQPVQESLCLL